MRGKERDKALMVQHMIHDVAVISRFSEIPRRSPACKVPFAFFHLQVERIRLTWLIPKVRYNNRVLFFKYRLCKLRETRICTMS